MPWVSLIGFMCSGKSSTGRTLARQLGWPHFDTDAVIVERVGMSVDEIFRERGEAAFRALEAQIVEELPPERDLVLSTGGGLVLNQPVMEILAVQGPIFWLNVDKADVLERCQRPWAARRPLLRAGEDLAERIDQLMTEREPIYRKYGAPIPGGFAHPREAGRHILNELSLREEFRVYFGRGQDPE
ncbi:MAG: shikimate kinase [Gemmatimonadota bacterium]|nr:MAG: shikimate kinase [Gemmatimonadota bacterium]